MALACFYAYNAFIVDRNDGNLYFTSLEQKRGTVNIKPLLVKEIESPVVDVADGHIASNTMIVDVNGNVFEAEYNSMPSES